VREWDALCGALRAHGAPDLAADARFATVDQRARHDAELAGVLASVLRGAAAVEWEARLVARDVACVEVAPGPVARAVMNDPVTRDAGFLTEVEHPTFGVHRRLAPIVTLSATPGTARPAPTLGMHTEPVLRELGYTTAEIASLVERKIAVLPA
jgi:crotonobetainyl-CoA:carnitine CoA-transferase CaiB-like acyl-CoA transferase